MATKQGQSRLFGRAYETHRARKGLDVTLARLRDSGRLEEVDAAWIALARITADQLDAACSDPEESRYTRSVLAKVHLAVLDRLITRPDSDVRADLDALFPSLHDPTSP